MIADKLRKSILQAAIQGKLTERLPEDGDARELLAEIQAEKARLIKEGKIKKEKPLPAITEDEILFDIPENWCWVRLQTISKTISAGGDKPKIFSETRSTELNIPVVSNGKKDNGIFGYTDIATITEQSVTISGRGTIGFSCVRDYPFCPIVRLITVIPSNNIVPKYLEFVLTALLENGVGTSIQQLTVPMVSPKIIPLPPLTEQHRIVHKIGALLPELDRLEKDEQKLNLIQKSFPKKMKDSLLQAAIQGKLTEQLESDGDARALVADIQKEKEQLIREGKIKREKALPEITEDEIPFDIPDNWCWVRLGDITDYGVGKQVNQNNIAPNSWILELEDIEKETFKLNCKRYDRNPGSSKNGFIAGDVLYGKLRPYLKKVIVTDEAGYCSTEIIPFHGYGNINSSYLKYCMVAPAVDSYINQITHGMDMPRLGTDKAKQLIIPLPPLAEQHRIVERLEQLLPLCDALE